MRRGVNTAGAATHSLSSKLGRRECLLRIASAEDGDGVPAPPGAALVPYAAAPSAPARWAGCDADSAGHALLAHAARVCGPLLAGEVHVVSEDLRCPPAESLHILCPLQLKERAGAANSQRMRLPHKLVKSGIFKLLGHPATEVDLRDLLPRRWVAKDRLLRHVGALGITIA